MKTGAQIVAECLIEQGVDTFFGYPGGSVITLYDAFYEYKDRINHILTAHEQHAAHAADGYARSSGKVGVCVATSGPGATNLVTGIATAFMDSIPVVAITGNVALDQLGKDSFQEIDIFGVTMPITKHNFIVKDITELADTIRRAFNIAQSDRPGPVLVDILKSVLVAKTEYEPKEPAPITKRHSLNYTQQLSEAVQMIQQSKKPLIYAGGGVISAQASELLYAFAKRIGSPVTLSLMGLGAFPQTSKQYTGMIGMHGSKVSGLAVNSCDLLITVGARFSDRVLCNVNTFAKKAKILQLDIDRCEVNKNIRATSSVEGDIKETLTYLFENTPYSAHEEWLEQIAFWKKSYPHIESAHDISPQYVIECVSKLLNEDDIVVTDVGQHQVWAAQCYPVRKPRTFITSGGLGTMGFGMGAAIGASFAHPDKQVLLFTGDGSFHMNLIELVTAVVNKRKLVVIVMNNSVLGMVRQWQKLLFQKRYSQTTLNRPTDYVKLAQAFGAVGFRIHSKEEVMPVLCSAFKENNVVVIDCIIDKDVNVLPMVPAGQNIDEPVLHIDN